MSTEVNPNPAPAQQQIQPGSSPAAVSPPTVPILLEDFHRLRAVEKEFNDFRAKQAQELQAKEQARLDALAESGKHKEALEETRKNYDRQLNDANGRYSQLEQTVYQKETKTTLAQSLAGRTFSGKTPEQQSAVAAQLLSILEPRFEASRSANGDIQVRDKVTGRPAPDVLKEALESEDFAHFFVATNRGGAGSDATRSPGNPAKDNPGSLKSIAAQYLNRQAEWSGVGLGGNAGSRKGG